MDCTTSDWMCWSKFDSFLYSLIIFFISLFIQAGFLFRDSSISDSSISFSFFLSPAAATNKDLWCSCLMAGNSLVSLQYHRPQYPHSCPNYWPPIFSVWLSPIMNNYFHLRQWLSLGFMEVNSKQRCFPSYFTYIIYHWSHQNLKGIKFRQGWNHGHADTFRETHCFILITKLEFRFSFLSSITRRR